MISLALLSFSLFSCAKPSSSVLTSSLDSSSSAFPQSREEPIVWDVRGNGKEQIVSTTEDSDVHLLGIRWKGDHPFLLFRRAEGGLRIKPP